MCRDRDQCVVLMDDPQAWDRLSPLAPLPWLPGAMDEFKAALACAAVGDDCGARDHLARTRSSELRAHFVEHGQMAYRFRGHGSFAPARRQVAIAFTVCRGRRSPALSWNETHIGAGTAMCRSYRPLC